MKWGEVDVVELPRKVLNDFYRFSIADNLIDELNDPQHLERESIARLKETLLALTELRRKARRGEPIQPDELQPVNATLARHQWVTQVEILGDDLRYKNILVSPGAGAEVEESYLRTVITLAQNGMLDRIRRCDECSEWFYARRRHYDKAAGSFCSTKHQQKFWRHKPEVKEQRRKYQKKYYRDFLSPATRRSQRGKKKREKS
jgi:hypothetical protein